MKNDLFLLKVIAGVVKNQKKSHSPRRSLSINFPNMKTWSDMGLEPTFMERYSLTRVKINVDRFRSNGITFAAYELKFEKLWRRLGEKQQFLENNSRPTLPKKTKNIILNWRRVMTRKNGANRRN